MARTRIAAIESQKMSASDEQLTTNNGEQTLESIVETKAKNDAWDISFGIFCVIAGTLMYGSLEIVVTLTQTAAIPDKDCESASSIHDRSHLVCDTGFSFSSILVLSETLKFIISFTMLYVESNSIKKTFDLIKANTLWDWVAFSVPATVYAITNSMDWPITKFVDAATFKTLSNVKILTSAVLWWLWFRKNLTKQQMIALILLCIGLTITSMPDTDHDDASADADTDTASTTSNKPIRLNSNTMRTVSILGVVVIFLQATLSAFAAVYTEAIYKKYGRNRSIHLENMSMYLFGMLINFMFHIYTVISKHSDRANTDNTEMILDRIFGLFYGFNAWCFICVFNFAFLGLAIANVLKRFDNIVKVLMGGAAVIISGILNLLLLKVYPTRFYLIGSSIVITSILLFQIPLRSRKT